MDGQINNNDKIIVNNNNIKTSRTIRVCISKRCARDN